MGRGRLLLILGVVGSNGCDNFEKNCTFSDETRNEPLDAL